MTGAIIGACRSTVAGQPALLSLAQSRGLRPEDAARALKTFVPPGGRDEFVLFASGGHSGQIHVIGVPSMRLLKTIAVFTPGPWQGYGYGADWSETALGEGRVHGPHAGANAGKVTGVGNGDKSDLRWGDSHHPALSETDGKYDGRWLYINDRAHGRIGMVDLGDFRTKQILQVPNIQTSHGGIFATPDTKYVHISSKVPALKAWNKSKGQTATLDDHLNRYADIYRGYSTFVSVDPKTGRMDLKKSFQIDPKNSWMVAASEKNLPIIVPGWEDATLGNMYAGHVISGDVKNVHTVRTGIEYMTWLAEWYTKNAKRLRNGEGSIGFFQIGGGIAGDFPICVVPMLHQDLQRTGVPLWGYFSQISESTTSYGSYSGAVPNEKITWGKLGATTPKFIIESDATIVAPLIFAWVLGQ
jgi:hypothetical protein